MPEEVMRDSPVRDSPVRDSPVRDSTVRDSTVRGADDRAPLKVALLGCGSVGSQVYRLLTEQSADLKARAGAPLEIVGVAVREPGRPRDVAVNPDLLTTDGLGLVTRPDVDIVIELIGGIEPARTLLMAALSAGKSVVTANKALVAGDRAMLHKTASAAGVDLYYEAAVAGAIPLLRALRESLAGDEVQRVLGIVNGTTNFILDRMDTSGADFSAALAEAQALGYAEADPTADVAGFDAASKAAILASIAFHTEVTADDVYREGILSVTAADIASAKSMGYVVKLLAICERSNGGISARVHPAMIPRTHPLAAVREAYNAVFVEAESAGRLMFYGAGAGGQPTASAVLGDTVAIARNMLAGLRGPDSSTYAQLPLVPIGDARTSYYVQLDVADRPGVLAPVADAFAQQGVSIKALRQEGRGDDANLLIMTHVAREAALAKTVAVLGAMEAVRNVDSVMRVEAEEGE
ncbi:MAG TPA: homoserine dehydrogenase [Streptosporangiaceae bacterium]|jgi:homoserine dehydrogenase|nr:homoserine dehydrogenase [Streptosporangiaceae bacterium]